MFIYNGIVTKEIMDLLLEADPCSKSIETYLHDSTKFAVKHDGSIIGICLVRCAESMAEIKNISINKSCQNQGFGSGLLQNVVSHCEDRNINSITVGTGNSSIGQLYFYQKNGFRIKNILHDYYRKYSP